MITRRKLYFEHQNVKWCLILDETFRVLLANIIKKKPLFRAPIRFRTNYSSMDFRCWVNFGRLTNETIKYYVCLSLYPWNAKIILSLQTISLKLGHHAIHHNLRPFNFLFFFVLIQIKGLFLFTAVEVDETESVFELDDS